MNLRAILLYPFAVAYRIVTGFRNHLFNIGYSRSFNYEIMSINVGNLSVGGTGKTPMVEYLLRLLASKYALATLSRGYKRKSKGFLLASNLSTVEELGDEPLQLFKKFGQTVVVAVGEERALAIPKILMEHPETQIVLLDDAFQHRTVLPDFNILLTQFSSPFYSDFVLPAGLLRESRVGAKRADVIVITKCPTDLDNNSKNQIINKVHKYTTDLVPVYFSCIQYGMPISFIEKQKFTGRIILFAGLANMDPLISYIKNSFDLLDVISFPDHYDYKLEDINKLILKAKNQNAQLLTTEKDIVKLQSSQMVEAINNIGLFYLPISVQFLFNEGSLFNEMIFKSIKAKYESEEAHSVKENI